MRLNRFGVFASAMLASLLFGGVSGVAAQKRPEPLRLVLNVPENRLYVYQDGVRTHEFRTAVGLPGYETPGGSYRIHEVIWNPWWHPPDSEWARNRTVESPGSPSNPMGRVKMYFAPLLYIHGTPEEQTLGRAASRGCVRMSNEDLFVLTRLIHGYASPGVPTMRLERLRANPTQTEKIQLRTHVPFTVVYRVAAIQDGFLHLFPDLYGLVGNEYEDQVWGVLEDAGLGPGDVDRAKLDRLLSKGPTRKVAMSLDTLTAIGSVSEAGQNHQR